MHLDPDVCYRALISRDARFDGHFFTAVLTTGVYCRPVCPARKPKRRNVRFLPSAAAAELAGFRPCLRCHPEKAPSSPAWLGASHTVTRALELIDQGALDRAGVEELASQVEIIPRHLRRLFDEHLGPPAARHRRRRRAHFAKQLLDETELPIIDVAYGLGYASLRRFNSTFKEVFGAAPSELRRAGAARTRTGNGRTLTLKLATRPPFDWVGMLAFLQRRAIPGVEWVDCGSYRRTVRFGDRRGLIEVRLDDAEQSAPANGRHLRLSVPVELARHLMAVVTRVKRLFDLKAEPRVIRGQLASDPQLAPLLAAHPGIRVPGAWDPFEVAVRAVLGQQVNVAAATTLAARLAERYGTPMPGPDDQRAVLFPTPAALSDLEDGHGLTRRRSETIRTLARAVQSGQLELERPQGLEARVAQLCRLPGIGP